MMTSKSSDEIEDLECAESGRGLNFRNVSIETHVIQICSTTA